VVVRNALEQHRLKRENRVLRQQISEDHASAHRIDRAERAMRHVREQIETVAEWIPRF